MIRRGTVVGEKPKFSGGYTMYGRVWRVLGPEHVLVIDTGKHVRIYHPDDLEVFDYAGYIDGHQAGAILVRREYPVFRPMPSLRALKKRGLWYNKTIWATQRPKWKLLPNHVGMGGRYAQSIWTGVKGSFGKGLKEYLSLNDL